MGSFDVALLQTGPDAALDKRSFIDLLNKVDTNTVIPLEIDGDGACAYGFISEDMADRINSTELKGFIREILNDVEKESEDCSYTFQDPDSHIFVKIYLDYEEIYDLDL